jgi:hypothetical protein
MSRSQSVFNALIRTHHITSRKKLRLVRKAATDHDVDLVLIRSGGSPGIMYAEGRSEVNISEWVAAVQSLRYKDFKCVRRPAECLVTLPEARSPKFTEVSSVSEFSEEMDRRKLGNWWKEAFYD